VKVRAQANQRLVDAASAQSVDAVLRPRRYRRVNHHAEDSPDVGFSLASTPDPLLGPDVERVLRGWVLVPAGWAARQGAVTR
jgi:hypothetical protein